MPTPIGHSLFALSAVMIRKGQPLEKRDLGLIVVSMTLANLPDIDFTPMLVYGFRAVSMFHQAYTHNLGFCLIGSIVSALIAAKLMHKRFFELFPFFFILVFSHIILDAMGNDTNPPCGVQLLWPLVDRHFMLPFPVFIGIAKSSARELFSLWNLMAVGLECVIFLPILGLVSFLNYKRWSALSRR